MGALRNAIPGPVEFPVNHSGKLLGPVFKGAFKKWAQSLNPDNSLWEWAH